LPGSSLEETKILYYLGDVFGIFDYNYSTNIFVVKTKVREKAILGHEDDDDVDPKK